MPVVPVRAGNAADNSGDDDRDDREMRDDPRQDGALGDAAGQPARVRQ